MSKITILAIDDDRHNLDILRTYLVDDGFNVITANNGEEGWQTLEEVQNINLIMLDRMMPALNGIAFMSKIKLSEKYSDIPVIMQTAAATQAEIAEGINSGVFYYLTKPYDEELLLAIVHAALEDKRHMEGLRAQMARQKKVIPNIISIKIRFHTLEDANEISSMLAGIYPEPERVIFGINEMMTNAIEHGNAGITYDEKGLLSQEGEWQKAVALRLARPENRNKYAEVSLEKDDSLITLRVKDSGAGFEWKKYLTIDPERATHINGRGIALAKLLSFDDIMYNKAGNEVTCITSVVNQNETSIAS